MSKIMEVRERLTKRTAFAGKVAELNGKLCGTIS